ncbi:MAG: carboxypeptidase-like regulatory domain-containing protein, partial [Gallionella sp.]|nr:carboxypeptidase-like regulatory domain-containing protein [Gallionella sp.]
NEGEPIAGVDVKLGKNPGGSIAVVRTGKDGSFEFKKLPQGNYTLTISGQPSQSLTVGSGGGISGKVSPNGFFDIFVDVDPANASVNGRVINNSETDTANVKASNRDHIDHDAQADLEKKTAVQTGGGAGKSAIFDRWGNLRTDTSKKAEDEKSVSTGGSGGEETLSEKVNTPETPGGFGTGGPGTAGPDMGGMGGAGMNPDMMPTGPVMSPVMTPPAGGAMGGFGGAGNPMMGPAGRH